MKFSFLGSVGYWMGLQHLHFNRAPPSNSDAVFLDGSHLGDTAHEGSEVCAAELPIVQTSPLTERTSEVPGF